jgi:hypothetical protein
MRHYGRIQESLQLFQAAVCMNPDNKENLKQVRQSLIYSIHILANIFLPSFRLVDRCTF